MESFDKAYQRMLKTDEPPGVTGPLREYWDQPVSTLCQLREPWKPTPEWQERHRIYCYLLMALLYHYWNGYKYGRPRATSDYPLNPTPMEGDPAWLDGTWFGYNIGALAVDRLGYVLDFDFNHNDLFNSSAEHAEARLVRRLYSLAQISDSWGALPETPDERSRDPADGTERRRRAAESLGNDAALSERIDRKDEAREPGDVRRVTLTGVTVYTSLESCAQCAGVMALAQIQEVVYLQTDPQYFFIGRILRNLTTERGRAPLPISGGEIDLSVFAKLEREFKTFADAQDAKQGAPFWQGAGQKRWSSSISSFLCTSTARDIFKSGGAMLNDPMKYERFDGSTSAQSDTTVRDGKALTPERKGLTNTQVRAEAVNFLDYATRKGRRGTPHNL